MLLSGLLFGQLELVAQVDALEPQRAQVHGDAEGGDEVPKAEESHRRPGFLAALVPQVFSRDGVGEVHGERGTAG